jgi:hypothetical protein
VCICVCTNVSLTNINSQTLHTYTLLTHTHTHTHIGAGGPYRELFTEIGTELRHSANTHTQSHTPNAHTALIPTRNNDGTLTIAPHADNIALDKLHVIGILFGCAMRTGMCMCLEQSQTWIFVVCSFGVVSILYLLPTTHYPLPTTHYPLPTTHYPLPTTQESVCQ